LTYHAFLNQIDAESSRTALEFSKAQRKAAYADYLAAVTDLENNEYKMSLLFSTSGPADMKPVIDEFAAYTDSALKCSRISSTVRLVGSKEITTAQNALIEKHNDLQRRINELMAAANAGMLPTMVGKASELSQNLDVTPDMEQHFINAAKHDLGLVS
jgi:hypothetical protein